MTSALADGVQNNNHAYAIVCVPGQPGKMYYVVTFRAMKIGIGKVKLQTQLSRMTFPPVVHWVRYLDEYLQQLFGWSDAPAATRDNVTRACNARDKRALLEMMPKAEVLIRHGCFETLAMDTSGCGLGGCKHTFVHELQCRHMLSEEARGLELVCAHTPPHHSDTD